MTLLENLVKTILPEFLTYLDKLMEQKQPRGIRNNNPGNIKWSSNWLGLKQDGKEQDPSFCVFISAVYGIRALARLLLNYQKLYGLDTPRKIISRYAPPSENQTQAYIQSVATQLGITPDGKVDLTKIGTLTVFIKAIIRHENGIQPYSNDKQTLENQEFEIKNFCEKESIQIDKLVMETISGTKDFEKKTR